MTPNDALQRLRSVTATAGAHSVKSKLAFARSGVERGVVDMASSTRSMKVIAFLIMSFCSISLFPASAADKREQPPSNIIEHYKWSLLPKYRPNAIARLEGFWAQHHPKNEEYEDAIHVRFVRLCAYRLAELCAADGQVDKCREMLRWLQAHDQAIPQ